ncbi:hypothetical protein ACQKL5_00925 [Peribacillus sp. NPDC097675]|uniref:hypothetical protein n=1 Tax=Peribacillus sp. NPDC097675 TaxID=3390618 RepID=UPI003CFCC7A0
MDKSEKRKGVKIKINGEEKIFYGENKREVVEEIPEAAGEEQPDDSFEWILPEDSPENKIVLVPTPPKKKMPKLIGFGTSSVKRPNNRSVKTFMIAVFCAILFGSVLGLIAVNTITKEKAADAPVETAITTTATPPVEKKNDGGAKEKGAELKTFLVQGGMFSSEDAAKKIQGRIMEKQVPAEVFKLEDSYYLFLGSAENLISSKELALFLKSYDVDVFWKEIDLKATGISTEEEKPLETMKGIYSSLSEFSATELRGKEATWNPETLKKDMDKLKAEKLSSDLSQMNTHLTAAAKLVNDYEVSKKEEQLLKAQGELLKFLKGFQSMDS